LVNDGMGVPTNGCEPILNAAEVNGKVALIDRGGCPFVVKVKNAQDAGAIAVVVADSMPGCPALGMSGVDPTITIPVVRVTFDDGLTIKTGLPLEPDVNMLRDPSKMAGADAAGRVFVYTPVPFALGSSVSHWDTSCDPNVLMEPALNPELSSKVDLTQAQMADIGWYAGFTAVGDPPRATHQLASYPNPMRSGSSISYTLEREDVVDLAIYDLGGRLVRRLVSGRVAPGSHTVPWNGTDRTGRSVPPGIYVYRLTTTSMSASRHLAVVR
jgi:hypothetical protein